MISQRSFLRATLGAATLCLFGPNLVAASDCFRQSGIGYSAGYHATAPFAQSPTCAKLPGWLGWKSACCQPGGMPTGCGCGPVAPACGSCWSLPRLGCSPCGGGTCFAQPCGAAPCGAAPCGCGTGCFPRPSPGIY